MDKPLYARLTVLPIKMTVCKVKSPVIPNLTKPFTFLSVTDREYSLVCPTEAVPSDTVAREDGWLGFRIDGQLDFGLIGILSRISGILAEGKIGIFAISTFDTDYILVKEADFERSLSLLCENGYEINR